MSDNTIEGVSVEVAGDSLLVRSPYHAGFISAVKDYGGRWDAAARAWVLPADLLDAVWESIGRVYGVQRDESADINVELTALKNMEADRGPIRAGGVALAAARGRDTGAKVAQGVALLDGSVWSGGSQRYWLTKMSKGSRLIARGLTRSQVDAIDSDAWLVRELGEQRSARDEALERIRAIAAEHNLSASDVAEALGQ